MGQYERDEGGESMKKEYAVHVGYGVSHTLAETAQVMGISRERVRQIERRALAKIRKILQERYGITGFS